MNKVYRNKRDGQERQMRVKKCMEGNGTKMIDGKDTWQIYKGEISSEEKRK